MRNTWNSQSNEPRLSFKNAIFRIILSTILISGTTALILLYYFHIKEIQQQDKRYHIRSIVQTEKRQHLLPTQYLAELLDLHSNSSTNLFQYDTDEAETKLAGSPVILEAKVRKVKPDTLSIEYALRIPKFVSIDYLNTGIDEEGILIPLKPFFENNDLPQLRLGQTLYDKPWGQKIPSERISPIYAVLSEIKKTGLSTLVEIQRIDISSSKATSLGQRQIILICKECLSGHQLILRLRNGELAEQIQEFAILYNSSSFPKNDPRLKIIDLRIPNLAFLQQL